VPSLDFSVFLDSLPPLRLDKLAAEFELFGLHFICPFLELDFYSSQRKQRDVGIPQQTNSKKAFRIRSRTQ